MLHFVAIDLQLYKIFKSTGVSFLGHTVHLTLQQVVYHFFHANNANSVALYFETSGFISAEKQRSVSCVILH